METALDSASWRKAKSVRAHKAHRREINALGRRVVFIVAAGSTTKEHLTEARGHFRSLKMPFVPVLCTGTWAGWLAMGRWPPWASI